MDKSAITMTTGCDWWLERVTMDGEQRYPERIRVGSLERPRVYVPERTCQFVYDEKPDEYMCSACGKQVSGSNPAAEYQVSDKAVLERFNFCPHCGARVIEEES